MPTEYFDYSEKNIADRMADVVRRFVNDEVVVYEHEAYALNSAYELCWVHVATIKQARNLRILAPVGHEKTTLQGFMNLCRDIARWECEEYGPLPTEKTPEVSQTSEFKVDPYEMT